MRLFLASLFEVQSVKMSLLRTAPVFKPVRRSSMTFAAALGPAQRLKSFLEADCTELKLVLGMVLPTHGWTNSS